VISTPARDQNKDKIEKNFIFLEKENIIKYKFIPNSFKLESFI
jgi:hypothetical protein